MVSRNDADVADLKGELNKRNLRREWPWFYDESPYVEESVACRLVSCVYAV